MENLLNMMRTWDGLHQVGDGLRHATWSNPSSAAPEILITRKIVRKIYTLMISRESSSLLTCWLSIITIWNKEFANLDQILILEMNFRHVIFNHYLDVTLDLLDFALNKNINPGYSGLIQILLSLLDLFPQKWKSCMSRHLLLASSDRNEPFISLNAALGDYVIPSRS